MVELPAGEFMMGSPDSDEQKSRNETSTPGHFEKPSILENLLLNLVKGIVLVPCERAPGGRRIVGFISYRRGQDAGFAGRLFDRLERTVRRKALFMDVDSIAPGQDFVSVLECDVVLALIGRGWLTATGEAGRRRLDK